MEKVNPLLVEERCIFHFEVRTDLARGCRLLKLLSKRCCEIAWFPPPPARSSQHSSPPIYPLSPLINYFSLSCLCVLTNKRNFLSLSRLNLKKRKKKKRERILRNNLTCSIIVQSRYGKKIAKAKDRQRETIEGSTVERNV